ncbi:MAG: MFS transporter [Candidatus Acidiferrales bacterium]
MPEPSALTGRKQLADLFGFERNVAAASGAIFLIGLGEELWKKFLPKYLESLGASTVIVGLFGTAEDFFDALYQYPGGWLADYWGRRRAFLTFLAAATVGYLIYFFSRSWSYLFLGLGFVMAWQSMGSPAIFATIGDSLPPQKRTMGFTIQSILKRIPMVVSPLIGGFFLGALGIQAGMRVGLGITLALAVTTVPLLLTIELPAAHRDIIKMRGVWKSFHPILKRLLLSDITIRTCEGMADIFVVLYVTNMTGITIPQYGVLVAVQLSTSILMYFPSAKIADRVGRKPVVIATFLFFALFPVAVVLAHGFASLACAFVIGGLREVGEPARKAMIVDLTDAHLRGRTVGLYYLTRSLSITPASAAGGLLWRIRPEIPFLAAGIIGIAGTILFSLTVQERNAA